MSFSNKPDAGHAMSGPITKQSADAWVARQNGASMNTTETKVTHTPGPWRFSTDSGTVGQAKLNGVEVIAVIEAPPLGTNKWDTDALLANGAIIAAAPDMLEALEAAIADLEEGCYAVSTAEKAKAAIAKAKGGKP